MLHNFPTNAVAVPVYFHHNSASSGQVLATVPEIGLI